MLVAIKLTLLLFCGLAVFFYRQPKWAFPVVVFFLPFERIGSYALNPASGRPIIRIVQVIIAAFVASALIRFFGQIRDRKKVLKLLLPLGAFIVTAGVSAALPNYTQLWTAYFTLLVLAALVVTVSATLDEHSNNLAYWALVVSASAVCLFGLFQFFGDLAGLPPSWTGLLPTYTKTALGFPRIQSTAMEPLYFANYLLIPLFMIGWRWLNDQLKLPRLEISVLILISLTFLLTMSRGAFVSAVAATIIGLVFFRPKISWSKKIGKLTASGAILIVLTIGLLSLSSRITHNSWIKAPKQFFELSSSQLTKSVSYTDREQTRRLALDIWKQNPLFGVGLSGIGPYLHNYPPVYTHGTSVSLNNQAFDLLAEVGAIGFVAYYTLLAGLLLSAWRRQEQSLELKALAIALIAITAQAQSFSGFLIAHNWVLLGWLVAIIYKSPARQTEK